MIPAAFFTAVKNWKVWLVLGILLASHTGVFFYGRETVLNNSDKALVKYAEKAEKQGKEDVKQATDTTRTLIQLEIENAELQEKLEQAAESNPPECNCRVSPERMRVLTELLDKTGPAPRVPADSP